jgi:DNA-binding beta-propeller fold protein YncE
MPGLDRLGAFVRGFASGGGLVFPQGLAFGLDGHLYVASGMTDQILRYDGVTGAFIDVFVAAGSGGLDLPRGIVFGPDGHLYVVSEATNRVLRYVRPADPGPGARV